MAPSGHVVLSDFGLACQATNVRRMPRGQCGTPGYIAPEILGNGLLGTVWYDQRADVWSLGIVLLEMFIGSPVPIYQTTADDPHGTIATLTQDPKELKEMQEVLMRDDILYDLLTKVRSSPPQYNVNS